MRSFTERMKEDGESAATRDRHEELMQVKNCRPNDSEAHAAQENDNNWPSGSIRLAAASPGGR